MAANDAGDVGLSCVLSVVVNITNYLVLTDTSPLTYQVLLGCEGVVGRERQNKEGAGGAR